MSGGGGGVIIIHDGATTREERLNNPGGIEHEHGTIWRGQSIEQLDPRFVRFVTFIDGIRALAKVMRTYLEKDGVRTVEQAIHRWAPPMVAGVVENDTESYILDVCQRCSVDRYDLFNPKSVDFIRAVIHHENGKCIYTNEEIQGGIDEAWA